MRIELVIFDCDGVLVDSESITTRTLVDAARDEGLDWTFEHVLHTFRGSNLQHVMADATAALGRPLAADFVERFRARLYERLRSEIEPVPGIVEALDALPHPCCVASNGPREKMEATLGTTGLLPRFEGRVFSAYDVGAFKPDPGLFLHAARSLDADPAACVVVEDSDHGLLAAHRAGMRSVAYVGHGVAMQAEATVRLDDMRGLVRALAGIAAEAR